MAATHRLVLHSGARPQPPLHRLQLLGRRGPHGQRPLNSSLLSSDPLSCYSCCRLYFLRLLIACHRGGVGVGAGYHGGAGLFHGSSAAG